MLSMISELKQLFGEWIAAVDRAINSIAGRVMQQRQILLIEGDGKSFTANAEAVKQAPVLPDVSFRLSNGEPVPSLPAEWETALRGSRIDIALNPDHFLFRSLHFPQGRV